MQSLRRSAKNFAYNYSEAQKAVREATSNSPWGPTTSQMVTIADYMRDPVGFDEVMGVLWKRLNDSGKNWRHVFKSLCVLDFLIKAGNERVAILCRGNLYAIETLRDFQHVEEGRDQGIHIRDKAKQLAALLANGRTAQDGAGSSSGAIRTQPRGEAISRPSNISEEEEQLRVAMELSLQDQQRTESMKDDYEVRLQQAIEESKREAEKAKNQLAQKPESFELTGKPKSNVDDLLSLGDLNINTQPSSSQSLSWYNGTNDPFAIPQNSPSAPPSPSSFLASIQATAPPPSQIPGIDNDPWSPQQQAVQYTPYSIYDSASIAPPSVANYGQMNGTHGYADPFSANPYDTLVDYDNQNSINLAQSSKFLRTEGNSNIDSLVSLDNIGTSNPFLTANAEAKRTPTLNELRAQHQFYPTPPISPHPSSIPPSQMPPISSTNPFASTF